MRILLIALCLFFMCGCGWIIYEDGRPIGSYAGAGPYGDYAKYPEYSLGFSGLHCYNATRAGYHYGVEYCEWDCARYRPMDARSITGIRVEHLTSGGVTLREVSYQPLCR